MDKDATIFFSLQRIWTVPENRSGSTLSIKNGHALEDIVAQLQNHHEHIICVHNHDSILIINSTYNIPRPLKLSKYVDSPRIQYSFINLLTLETYEVFGEGAGVLFVQYGIKISQEVTILINNEIITAPAPNYSVIIEPYQPDKIK